MDRILRILFGTIIIAPILYFFIGLYSMGGSHTYHEEAREYLDSAQKVLIKYGICHDDADCTKKHILFASGGANKIGNYEFGGINIELYEISDPNVVGDIIKEFGEKYKYLRMTKVHLNIYESAHRKPKKLYTSVLIE